MKIVTFGVFDYFHYGHLRLFKRARAYGDYLIVAVQRDEEIHANKPEAQVLYTLEQRMEIIESLRCVDEVIPYSQVVDDIKNIEFDVLVLGGDQNHEGFQRTAAWCEENGKKIVRLSRTEGICSSNIKKEIK